MRSDTALGTEWDIEYHTDGDVPEPYLIICMRPPYISLQEPNMAYLLRVVIRLLQFEAVLHVAAADKRGTLVVPQATSCTFEHKTRGCYSPQTNEHTHVTRLPQKGRVLTQCAVAVYLIRGEETRCEQNKGLAQRYSFIFRYPARHFALEFMSGTSTYAYLIGSWCCKCSVHANFARGQRVDQAVQKQWCLWA